MTEGREIFRAHREHAAYAQQSRPPLGLQASSFTSDCLRSSSSSAPARASAASYSHPRALHKVAALDQSLSTSAKYPLWKLGVNLVAKPRSPAPAHHLTHQPPGVLRHGLLERILGLIGSTLEPRRLCSGETDRHRVLKFALAFGHQFRFVEKRPHVGISAARTDQGGRSPYPDQRGRRSGLPSGRRPQRGRRRDLDPLIRNRGQEKDLLLIRRPESGGDPQDRGQEFAAHRPDHAGQRARPVLLQVRLGHMLGFSRVRLWAMSQPDQLVADDNQE